MARGDKKYDYINVTFSYRTRNYNNNNNKKTKITVKKSKPMFALYILQKN